MYSYALLETGCYYLVQEKEESPITLIKINFDTDHCVFLSKYEDAEVQEFKRKSDGVHDILELLSEDKVKAWEAIFNSSQDAYYEEDDE
ncbi:MAG: hypothetical protein H7Y27_01775 [Gemmatimonadaceae bacterium]|nr:hypothetical protein [Chitinophagaceae bacterium]